MKIIDRILVIIFNLCLLLTAGITPALLLASNPNYYYEQFEKNGIYSYTDENGDEKRKIIRYIGGESNKLAMFSDEQLNIIITHITDYLFTDKESFELRMDDVYIIGDGVCDGVDIFGEKAVSHMADVKSLMNFAKWTAIVSVATLVSLIIYFIKRSKKTAKLFLKYTVLFYGVLAAFAVAFCVWSFFGVKKHTMNAFLDKLWRNVHYLLFPFQPQKYANSFFNDTLTQILTLELFMTAVVIVISVIALALTAWLTVAFILSKRSKNTD